MLLNLPKRGLGIQRMPLVKGTTKVTGCNLASAIPGRQGHESDGTATHGFEFLVVPLRSPRDTALQAPPACRYRQ